MVLIFPRQLARQSFVGYTTGVIKYFRILVCLFNDAVRRLRPDSELW